MLKKTKIIDTYPENINVIHPDDFNSKSKK